MEIIIIIVGVIAKRIFLVEVISLCPHSKEQVIYNNEISTFKQIYPIITLIQTSIHIKVQNEFKFDINYTPIARMET